MHVIETDWMRSARRQLVVNSDWMLNDLKTLGYGCIECPNEGSHTLFFSYFINTFVPFLILIDLLLALLTKFFQACPNLETLHIGYKNIVMHAAFRKGWDANFLKMIRFDRLTYLTFSSFDLSNGDFFEDVRY